MYDIGELLGILATIVGGSLIIFTSVFWLAANVDKKTCYQFGQSSNRDVEFVKYTAISWGCLTETNDGKRIDISNLREF